MDYYYIRHTHDDPDGAKQIRILEGWGINEGQLVTEVEYPPVYYPNFSNTPKDDPRLLTYDEAARLREHHYPKRGVGIRLFFLLEDIMKGDVLYTADLTVLAKSTGALCYCIQTVLEKGARLISVAECFDSLSEHGKDALYYARMFGQFDAASRDKNASPGRAKAKEEGLYRGRKKKDMPPEFSRYMKDYYDHKITRTKMAELLGISRSTLYKLIREYEKKHGRGDA